MKINISDNSESFLTAATCSASYNQHHSTRGEQALWRAVILQALEDAVSNSCKTNEKYHKTQALHWLEGTSKDFLLVCDYAGLSPEYVKKKIKHALSRGCKWRADAGCGKKKTKNSAQSLSLPEKDKASHQTQNCVKKPHKVCV